MDRCVSHLHHYVNSSDAVMVQSQVPSTRKPIRSMNQMPTTNAPTTFAIAPTIPLAPMPVHNKLVQVHVSKDYMTFNVAHFVAFKGFREKLHGHSYRLAVTITGQVGSNGYVEDLGEIKKISQVICKDLNASFQVPMKSDVLKISFDDSNVHIVTEHVARFRFLKGDCSLLPIVHTLSEELAMCIERRVQKVQISISEADQQFASLKRIILAEALKS